MSSTALVSRAESLPAEREWQVMLNMGETLYRSGVLPAHIKSAAATVAIILKGRELGIPAMHALSNIVVISGKPTANAELMLALVYRDHGDDALKFTTSTNALCEVVYKRRSWREYQTHRFTIEEAKLAGLIKPGTWTQYPAAMLRARCISAVARMAFPDSIGGLYTPDELGAAVDQDGQVVVDRAVVDPTPLRVLAEAEGEALITDAQRRHLWALAKEYYGKDEAEQRLHADIGITYPAAVRDGRPSLRALTEANAAKMIGDYEDAIRQEAASAEDDAPDDAEEGPDA
jgi:hypothetical protein